MPLLIPVSSSRTCVCQKMVILASIQACLDRSQRRHRKWGEVGGGYRQLSYIHLLSTLEKAAIDAGVNVPKLLDDSEVGAEAVNTITDL